MLGLTIALRLAQQGRSVVVFDAAPEVGGLTSTTHNGELSWDRFYHVIASGDRELLALLEELELSAFIRWDRTRTNFFDGEKLYPLNDVFDYISLPALGPVDKARLALNIVYAATLANGARLESISARQWLCNWSGVRTYQNLWQPLLRTKLGSNEGKASAAYIWSVIRRFYSARRGATRTEEYGYLEGGYARVMRAIRSAADVLGVEFRTGTAVDRISTDGSGLRVAVKDLDYAFDNAVFTGPSSHVPQVCPELSERDREKHRNILYQGVICTSLLMKKPLGGAYMTYITDESIPFTTVIEMSSLTGSELFDGLYLCYLPRYVPSDDPMLDLPSQNIEELFLRGLRRMFPEIEPDDIVTIDTAKSRHVVAIPTLNYSAGLPPIETGIPGFYVCNSAQIINAALAVNESVDLANRFASMILPEHR